MLKNSASRPHGHNAREITASSAFDRYTPIFLGVSANSHLRRIEQNAASPLFQCAD
jgi:hypothetical protein